MLVLLKLSILQKSNLDDNNSKWGKLVVRKIVFWVALNFLQHDVQQQILYVVGEIMRVDSSEKFY